MNYYGTISLTKLDEFVSKHPDAVKEVTFRDGHTEKMLNIDVRDRQQPGKFGYVAYISTWHKESGEKAYLCDLKASTRQETATMPQPKDVEYLKAAAQSAPVQQIAETFGAQVVGASKIDDVDKLPF